MSRTWAQQWLLLAALTCSASVHAQDRPSESDIFSSGPPKPTESAEDTPDTTTAAPPPPVPVTVFLDDENAPTDPVTIGGQIYLRAQMVALQDQEIEDYQLSVPTLLDVYLDARPNNRVRGFVLARMGYDPMLPDSVIVTPRVGTSAADNGTSGSGTLSALLGTRNNVPRVQLDQLWLRFDVSRALFITIGRQHVRWGTARFWTPADFLHPQRRNPLDTFDARRGQDMLKVHIPIESTAWNFYAYALAGGTNDTPTLYSVGGAVRAELVAGSNELGLGALVRRGAKPKFAADLSMAIGPFDMYGEAAVVDAGEIDRVGYAPDAMLPEPDTSATSMADQVLGRIQQAIDTYYPVYRDHGYKPQIVGGLNVTASYGDNDSFTLGIEYFYNGLGFSDPNVYPGLLFPHSDPLVAPASFFYLGQHYAAIFLLFPAPFSLDLHSFVLSTLCNASDRSCITRLDYTAQVLTHMRFEAYVAGMYGTRSGEFPFGIETPSIDGIRLGRQPAIFSAGIALRIAI